MIALLSPAKTLDFETNNNYSHFTISKFLNDSQLLIDKLKTFNSKELASLMNLSTSLSNLNIERYKKWNFEFSLSNSRQAILCFKGGVYVGLDVASLSDDDLLYSQNSIRILSGLHGVLRPLDLIQPYRLEMGTKLKNSRGKNLYEFWGHKITKSINESLDKYNCDYLLNLASNEYYSSILPKEINKKIINVKFLDKKNDTYKTISFFAKKARGAMAAFVVKNKIKRSNELKGFTGLGYTFDSNNSEKYNFVFTR